MQLQIEFENYKGEQHQENSLSSSSMEIVGLVIRRTGARLQWQTAGRKL